MHCSWAGITRILAENSLGTNCPAETDIIPLITSNIAGKEDITPQGDWSWKYDNSLVWVKQTLADSKRLLLNQNLNADQTPQGAVPSPALSKPPWCPWMPECPPVFPSHWQTVTWLSERKLFFFLFPQQKIISLACQPVPSWQYI